MRFVSLLTAMVVLLAVSPMRVWAEPDGASGPWLSLFDGKTLAGWKAAENPASFRVQDGAIVAAGPRAHLFYAGDVKHADFKNFELTVGVKATPGANSGVYFHTVYQDRGFPDQGYEVQINNTHTGDGGYYERKKTGSLYGIRNQYKSIVRDNQWFTMRIVVRGKRIQVLVEGQLLVDYTEPDHPVRTEEFRGRLLSHGTFALQCHDPDSRVFFKDLRVRPLPDNLPPGPAQPPMVDRYYAQIMRLQAGNFPLIDFHVHLKGGLTVAQALAHSRSVGVQYGIAPNCGLGFPITDDDGIRDFVEKMKGQPFFLGMQAEGREWVNLFSRPAIEQFDYVFTDAMTFTDDTGKRIRLWINDEVNIDDENAFMEMYVNRILSVLNHEPIDIYVNATFLPEQIADKYDTLWTDERMDRVIRAARQNHVAIEINARYKIPSARFIRRAKAAGVKFSLGTNNSGSELGRLEYCLDMIQQCGLTGGDMFLPNAPPSHSGKGLRRNDL